MNEDLLIGYRKVADGAIATARGERTGAAVITEGHVSYVDPVGRGAVMTALSPAGIAPGTVLSTTPPLFLWNPPSSGKNLAVFRTSMGYVSGTLGAGTVFYCVYASQNTVPTTGTEITPLNNLIGFPRGVGRAFTASTLAAIPTALKPAYVLGAFVGTTATLPAPITDYLDGTVILTPGTVFALQAIAGAGTSPLVQFAISWEELDI